MEERVAHLERANDDLSDVVADQAKRIASLEARVAWLMAREREREGGHVFGADERPPHW